MTKCDFFSEKEDELIFCLCSGIHAYFCSNKKKYFNTHTVRNLRLEHFESYSSFSYCTQSSVYRVFWSSVRVVDCNILILFRHSTTGPEHLIYKTVLRFQTLGTLKDRYFAFKRNKSIHSRT